MRRQDKFPDTDSFCFYNANPHNRFTTDCVARALAMATDPLFYNAIVRELAEIQIKTGFDTSDPHCYGRWLEQHGFTKQSQPRKPDGKKYTGKEFCELLKREGETRPIVAHLGGNHVVAIHGYKVCDTWDSTDGCIGNYWIKRG